MKFIDLFAGIGGFRIGMEKAGFECIYSVENDKHAAQMYEMNFNDNPFEDITKLNPEELPDFDILCAGFPCQSFSASGKREGFYDKTRGTLFFDILRIMESKQPRAAILENVKNLSTHDKGRTLNIIISSLEKIGYTVNHTVLNAKDFGVPQNRERTIIVCTKDKKHFNFSKLKTSPVNSMESFLDNNYPSDHILKPEEYTLIEKEHVKRQKQSGLIFVGYRNKKIRTKGVRENTEHLSRVHKQPNRIYSTEGTHPTFSSQETSGRYFIYDGKIVRKLTINEVYKIMGFPKDFIKYGSTGELYRRIGNSINPIMVESVAKGLKLLLEKSEEKNMKKDTNDLIEEIYHEANSNSPEYIFNNYQLTEEQIENVDIIIGKEQTHKGVFTVLVSSLFYKKFNPQQDVRRHQVHFENGYSGRTFDTKYVTPFLKNKRFRGAMKESGWLTRSLEQPYEYTKDYQGKISNKKVKDAFLSIFEDVEEKNIPAINYLMHILKKSLIEKEKQSVELINPIQRESILNIKEIIDLLEAHFYQSYTSRGASILPVVAIQSIYECLMKELSRFKDKKLDDLGSHYSSDKSSGANGDIVVRTNQEELYEVVEVKFEHKIEEMMIYDVYKKIKATDIQRYYILSTKEPTTSERIEMNKIIEEIKLEHGVEIIVNGLMKTLHYYLRLLSNTNEFINCYLKNIENNPEVGHEHEVAWNTICKEKGI